MGATAVLSLSQRKVKVGFWPWVVRWSKGSWFISPKVNPWHSQPTNRSIRDHFSIKQNHQGPSQRRLTNIWKNPNLAEFNGVVGGSVVNWQLFRTASKLNFVGLYMDRVFWAKRWDHLRERWPSGAPGATGFFGKYQWGIGTLGGSEVNYQLLSRSLRL